MTEWPDLEFVTMSDDGTEQPGPTGFRQSGADAGRKSASNNRGRTGWEEVFFEIADDEALD